MRLFIITFLIIGCTGGVNNTGPDTTFGTLGLVTSAVGSADDEAQAVALQSDGKLVVAGKSHSGSDFDFALVRYTTSGVLDSSFGTSGIVTTDFSSRNDAVYSLLILPDGSIVTGGSSNSGSYSSFAVAKYSSTGALDTSFGSSGKLNIPLGSTNDEIRAMAVQTDGLIVAVGFSKGASTFGMAAVRFSSSGTLDTDFDSDGKHVLNLGTSNDKAYSMALQLDGKILLAGSTVASGLTQMAVVRLLSTGALDTTFGSSGVKKISSGSRLSQDTAYGINVLSDNSILVSGDSSSGNAQKVMIARLTSLGALNTDFNASGILTTLFGSSTTELSSAGRAQTVRPSGNIFVVGNHTTSSAVNFGVLRVNRQGVLDTSFGTRGVATIDFGSNDEATAITLDGSTSLYIVGKAFSGSTYDFAVAKYFQ